MQDLIEKLALVLERAKQTLVTAESCTGGLLASMITARPHASTYFERGFVTYSNESKIECLGVPRAIIDRHGAVSGETARAMAEGALKNSRADLAVAITGIAGPDTSEYKPVGLVYLAIGKKNGMVELFEKNFTGTRDDIRLSAVRASLQHAINILQDSEGRY